MSKRSTIVLIIFLLACPICVSSQETKELEYVPGELLVKFRSGVSRQIAQATHRYLGSRAVKRFRRINVDHIKIPEGWSVEEAITVYRLDPDVEYAEPNYIRRALLMPNDLYFDRLWGLHNTGQTGGTQDADIDAPEAWDTQTGSSSVVIAVIDTGADLDHADIIDNIWKNTGEDWLGGSPGNDGLDNDVNGKTDDYYGWDFVNNDNDPDDDNAPDYHGTHVSGTIGAKGNNDAGITGVCWSASIVPLKILDANGIGSVASEIEAIDYAINKGAKIINVSSGGPVFSQGEYEAIESARDAGLLFVAAAGNDGDGNQESGWDNDVPGQEVYPASYDLDNIVAVAAADYHDDLALWSNYGPTSVDVAAPGVDIYSTKTGDSYQYLSGTSMAAPHVSGLAALILAADSSLTYPQIKDRILNGVETKSPLDGKILTGGRINANNSILNAPSPPTNLAATSVSSTQIDLIWTDTSSGETGFKIERKTGSGGAYSQIAAVSADIESYSDTALSESTTYYYRVRAYNSTGDSSYSNEASATTSPAAPGNLRATAVSTTQIDLIWTDTSSGETGFKIERKTGSGGTYSLITAISTNTTSYSDTELRGSTTYYYRVRAYNSSGNSSYSNEADATTFSSGGGCFIATAVYGSPMEAHVKVLRAFRNRFVLINPRR